MATISVEGNPTPAVQQLASRRRGLPQRRFALGGLVMLAAIAYLIVSSFSAAVDAVVSPSQLVHASRMVGQTIRLQGRVVGRETYNPRTLAHIFTISDGHHVVPVTFGGDLPGGFRGGASVEAQGAYDGHVFAATALTAKCPTKYQAAPAGT